MGEPSKRRRAEAGGKAQQLRAAAPFLSPHSSIWVGKFITSSNCSSRRSKVLFWSEMVFEPLDIPLQINTHPMCYSAKEK